MRFLRSISSRSTLVTCGLVGSLLFMTWSCASRTDFDRNTMRALLQSDPRVTTEQPVAVDVTTAPLALPFKLALFFVEREVPRGQGLHKVQWLSGDKDALVLWLKSLRDERIVSEVFPLTDPTIKGQDVRKIRQAAARYGMDAVLILDGIGAVDRFNNGYATLYPTLIGAYFAPGTECEALVMLESTLWDVRSDRLYLSQVNEGTWKSVGPTMSVENRDVLARAKHVAFEEFGSRITDRFRAMRTDRRSSPGLPR